MNRLRVLLVGWIWLLSVAIASAQSYDAQLQTIDEYAAQVQADWKVPGMAIAIVKDDELIFAKGYGVHSLEDAGAVDEHTLFAIASNSKAFTTACLAILVDEGSLRWDDPVQKYLPEFEIYDPYVTAELTVRDLVCHRSGLATFSGDLLWYETTYTADEILRRASQLEPTSSFRSRYGYQNIMYIAAGKVIERVSGETWADFVRKRILDPLEMDRTTTSVKDFVDNVAMPHNESASPDGEKRLRVLPHGNVDNCWGACGLNSSVADLSRWMRLQLGRGEFQGKKIFSADQSWEMWQPQTIQTLSEAAAQRNPHTQFRAYGLGWAMHDYYGYKCVGHGGGLDGMISQTLLVPQEKLGLVILTNSESPASSIMRQKIVDTMLGVANPRDWNAEALEQVAASVESEANSTREVDESRVADTQPSLPLEKYAGTYHSTMYGDATVTAEDGKLVLRLLPAPNFVGDLEHWHYDTFVLRWRKSVSYNFPRGFVVFQLNRAGDAEELIIDQPNNDFWFYELEFTRAE